MPDDKYYRKMLHYQFQKVMINFRSIRFLFFFLTTWSHLTKKEKAGDSVKQHVKLKVGFVAFLLFVSDST